jgi:mono/diheme cytochrome c family protein
MKTSVVNRFRFLFLASVLVGARSWLSAQDLDLSRLPPALEREVDFLVDVYPVLKASCLKCHGSEKPKGGFRLDSREDALAGGDYGEAILPGNSANSPFIHAAAHIEEDFEMPPIGKGDRLSAEQVGILRAWIDQGVVWEEIPLENSVTFELETSIRYIAIDGNQSRFRQLHNTREKWAGGVTRMAYSRRLDRDSTFATSADIWDDPNHFAFDVSYRKSEVGFAAAGFEQWRRYDNVAGGYYAPFGVKPGIADADVFVDHGRAWVEGGIALPKLPAMTVGYEYRYREGIESTLHWGGASGSVDGQTVERSVAPAFRKIDEQVHALWLDVSYDASGYQIDDHAELEVYDLETTRRTPPGVVGPPFAVAANDGYEHVRGANFVRVQKQIKDWWLVSAGHHFSVLDGEADVQRTFLDSATFTPVFTSPFSERIVFDRYAQTLNGNMRLGPWKDLSFTVGVQSDWTTQEGVGDVFLFPGDASVRMSADLDRHLLEEQFVLRYDGVSHSVLYADARLQQEYIDQRESQRGDTFSDFRRVTDGDGSMHRFGVGAEVSPWVWGSLNVRYQRYERELDFDHDVDETAFGDGEGYTAFIRGLEREGDELKTKFVLRPTAGVKITLTHRYEQLDYRTATDAVAGIAPGGSVSAADHEAHAFGVAARWRPVRRLHARISGMYRDTRTEAHANGSATVSPYDGDVITGSLQTVFIASDKMDLSAGYTYSTADFDQNHAAGGLPLGIEYEWHQIDAGVTRRINERVSVSLQYAYYRYDEPTSGGGNDFDGHGIFAAMRYRWE